MDLSFFKSCIAQGMSKEEALAFTKAAGESHSTVPKKSERPYGLLIQTMNTIMGTKGNLFSTAQLVEAAKSAGSLNPQGYADAWARTAIANKMIVRTSHGHYKTL
jgi:hypothetical protein